MTGFLAGDFFGVTIVLEGVRMIVLAGDFFGVTGAFGVLGFVGVGAALADLLGLLGVRGDAFTGFPPRPEPVALFAKEKFSHTEYWLYVKTQGIRYHRNRCLK